MSFIRMQLDPYRSRRMDRNDPKTGYSQWQAQRQRASNDDISPIQLLAYGQSLDSAYKQANQNDSFYFGLNGRIQNLKFLLPVKVLLYFLVPQILLLDL